MIGTRPDRPDGIDKVTGRARFGADMVLPGMLTGRVLRSPHAHARIRSIDTSKAEALPGVKAVVTRADFDDVPEEVADILDNCMAGDKALYDGHAVAAVAASSAAVARKALQADRGRVRGAAACHGCGRGDAGGRAGAARGPPAGDGARRACRQT